MSSSRTVPSQAFRLIRDDDALQLDFMTAIHGIRSFNGLRNRAKAIEIDGEKLILASLADIISSKRSADRSRDRAVLDTLETTLQETERHPQTGAGGVDERK